MKKILLMALTVMAISGVGYAQLSLTGEINARSEFRNGFKTPIQESQTNAFFTEQRTRLYFGFTAEKYEMKITFQDVRLWGATGQVHKTDPSLSHIADAWGKYQLTDALSFKVGRQMISYDNQRFFGGLEWAMQGRRHDAVLFMYEKEGMKLHIGGAYNQNPLDAQEPVKLTGNNYTSPGVSPYHATGNYKHMEYLWGNKKFESGANVSLYIVNDARQDLGADGLAAMDSINSRQTYGLMAGVPATDALTLNGEFFYQGGHVANETDLSALMFSLSVSYKTGLTPIVLGIDYLSGDDLNTADQEAFAPAFGTNHALYGFMDYFYVGNPHAGGLQDIYLKTKFKVARGVLLVHAHQFLTASDISVDDKAGSALGTELDLVYVKKLTPEVIWKIGYSQMFPTDAMDISKGGLTDSSEFQNWAWTQVIFKPKFL